MDVSYCAIASLIRGDLGSSIVHASEQLQERTGSQFVLNAEQFPPHVTHWIAYVPTKNLRNIAEKAKRLVEGFRPLELQITDISVESSGYVALSVNRSEQLVLLHQTLLDGLNDLREGYIAKKYIDELEKYTPQQQESIRTYGTRAAGQFYKPHITVGFERPDQVPYFSKKQFARLEKHHVPCTELILFKQREAGRSIDILDHFKLSGSQNRGQI